MLLLALCASMSAAAPDSVEALERLAPQARWTREALPELGGELVVLPTKLPNRFVVVKGRVAEATLEAAAPLWAPLNAARATQLVQAIERAELVGAEAPARLRAAGFEVADVKHPAARGPFVFQRLELRSAQSEPCVVSVLLALDEGGRVERSEVVVAQLPAVEGVGPADNAPAPVRRRGPADRSAELARFVGAARGAPR